MTRTHAHTPGPWTVAPPSGTGQPDSAKQYQGRPYREHNQVHARDANGLITGVAHVYQGEGEIGSPEALGEQLANARLIAAAPDLLEALEGCLPDLERLARTHGPGPDRRLEAAKAAIAKATGQ